jgi:heme exporter protein C
VLAPEKPKMPPEMLMSFGLSMAAFLLLFFALLRLRFRWATLRDARAAMEAA